MARMDVRIEIVRGMAGEAVARNGGPLPFAVALMALGTIGERMHACQREARPAMNLERLRVIPSPRRVAAVASSAQPRLVRVAVTVPALSGHAPLTAVTLIAGRGCVSPGKREAGPRVIEATPHVARGHRPARGCVAISAI